MSFLEHNPDLTILILGAVSVFALVLGFWWFAGRSPKADLLLPRTEPPQALSPVELSWIYARAKGEDFHRRCFVTAIVFLGLKYRIFLEHRSNRMTVKSEVSKATPPDKEFPQEVQILLRGSLAAGRKLSYDSMYSGSARWAGASLSKAIAASPTGQMFVGRNWAAILAGGCIASASIVLAAHFGSWSDSRTFGVIMAFVCGCCMGPAIHEVRRHPFRSFSIGPFIGFLLRVLLWTIVPILFFFFSWVVGAAISGEHETGLLPPMLTAAGMGSILSMVFTNPSRPTREGRQLLEEIEGFRVYLSGLRPNQLTPVNQPELTEERYEQLLPYAVALGEEWGWSKMFESHIEATEPKQPFKYRLRFYSGPVSQLGGVANKVANVVGAIHAPRGHR